MSEELDDKPPTTSLAKPPAISSARGTPCSVCRGSGVVSVVARRGISVDKPESENVSCAHCEGKGYPVSEAESGARMFKR